MPRVRALLSVANREGIADLARDLRSLDGDVVATDGTRAFLAGEGIDVGSVSDLTQVPPLVGGQVKTFHPAVYAGILARRDVPDQLAELEAHRSDQYVSSYGVALIHDALQERELALAALQRAYDERAAEFAMKRNYPPFKAIALEPRFKSIMQSVGLPE